MYKDALFCFAKEGNTNEWQLYGYYLSYLARSTRVDTEVETDGFASAYFTRRQDLRLTRLASFWRRFLSLAHSSRLQSVRYKIFCSINASQYMCCQEHTTDFYTILAILQVFSGT